MNKETKREYAWSLRMQERFSIEYYREFFPDDYVIIENDALNRVEDKQFDNLCEALEEKFSDNKTQTLRDLSRHLDYGGLDKIIFTASGTFTMISQRIRRDRKNMDTDFSFRVQSRGNKKPEIGKLTEALKRKDIILPPYYGFGIADAYTKAEGLERGFKFFAIYHLEDLLQDLIDGKLPTTEPKSNNDGTAGIYIPLDAIEKYAVQTWKKEKGEMIHNKKLWDKKQMKLKDLVE